MSKPLPRQAMKNDIEDEKPMMQLIPPDALEEIAKVFTYGARKYIPWNYLEGDGLSTTRLQGALMRHINSWAKGEDLDEESRMSHLAHAGCCVMMMIQIEKSRPRADDRTPLLRQS